MTIHHCTQCGYTGSETGWLVKQPHREPYFMCPNECTYDDGGDVRLAAYEDGGFPDLSEVDETKALAAMGGMSPVAKEAFEIGVMGMMR